VRSLGLVTALGLLMVSTACGGDDEEPATDAPESIIVSSTAFQPDQPIPARFSCNGDNVSPALSWEGLPADAKSVALVVDDPDAPRGTFTHWVVVDIPVGTTSVAEGAVPSGGKQAQNSAGDAAYAGPCPPSGTHHYRFTVYALSAPTGLADGAKLDDALNAIDKVTIARGRLTGTYAHQG
jgi:Raf kinase inhibitor-like YbhB/YbcL family protein